MNPRFKSVLRAQRELGLSHQDLQILVSPFLPPTGGTGEPGFLFQAGLGGDGQYTKAANHLTYLTACLTSDVTQIETSGVYSPMS